MATRRGNMMLVVLAFNFLGDNCAEAADTCAQCVIKIIKFSARNDCKAEGKAAALQVIKDNALTYMSSIISSSDLDEAMDATQDSAVHAGKEAIVNACGSCIEALGSRIYHYTDNGCYMCGSFQGTALAGAGILFTIDPETNVQYCAKALGYAASQASTGSGSTGSGGSKGTGSSSSQNSEICTRFSSCDELVTYILKQGGACGDYADKCNGKTIPEMCPETCQAYGILGSSRSSSSGSSSSGSSSSSSSGSSSSGVEPIAARAQQAAPITALVAGALASLLAQTWL